MYSEAISKGILTVSENTRVRDTVATAATLDSLIGAEIGSVWEDGRGTVYALACMERGRTVTAYTEIIRMNERNIAGLTTMSTAEKNTLDGYARYSLAAILAGINAKYANVVSQSGGSPAASLNISNADSLKLEASNIVKNISVSVTVQGDRANRIQDAFAKVLSDEGLRTQGSNPSYALQVNLALSEAVYPNSTNKFCRYTVSANLVERETGAVLFPFSLTGRDGRLTYEEAEERAIMLAEREIRGKYPAELRKYLASLLPRN
jgi:hypothetical protein